ncbi:hypothetical protein CK621_02805 [Vandammella animalimorsus]|uniref:Uncharacterized protein n=1 Tax=Vandammella animalimorsus TaxID=2029117 RepID=A0A2A2AYX0_9BURK|nr:hypothetical protein CK621_02805 [Vandammella animalimorsus]
MLFFVWNESREGLQSLSQPSKAKSHATLRQGHMAAASKTPGIVALIAAWANCSAAPLRPAGQKTPLQRS